MGRGEMQLPFSFLLIPGGVSQAVVTARLTSEGDGGSGGSGMGHGLALTPDFLLKQLHSSWSFGVTLVLGIPSAPPARAGSTFL